ncbi:MAG: hypothetical protein ACYC1L_00095 [Alphaproteobacteria bacterium]
MRNIEAMERRARWLIVPALALLAAGCSTVDDMTLGDRVAATSAPTAHPPAPRPAPAPPANDPPAVAYAPPARAPVKPPIATKNLEPAKLMGLTYDDTEAAAGKPAEMRDEPPATVWRYQTDDCVIDVFFYMDLATKQFRAVAYDVRPAKKTADAQRICAQLAKPRT